MSFSGAVRLQVPLLSFESEQIVLRFPQEPLVVVGSKRRSQRKNRGEETLFTPEPWSDAVNSPSALAARESNVPVRCPVGWARPQRVLSFTSSHFLFINFLILISLSV